MKYIDRIISVPEKFNLEIYIHAVHIQLPLQSQLHVIVKGNKKNTKKTEIFPHDQNTSMVFIKSTLVFQVTLYKNQSGYADKFYFFNLMQQRNTKTVKNGKGKINISSLVNDPLELIDLPLKNCSDPKAYICISASISQFSQALSFSSPSKLQIPVSVERTSNSFDNTILYKESVEVKAKEKPDKTNLNKASIEEKAKEKFLRRIEVVNSIHNSPQSARILEFSDSRSEFSPSSIRSPESPERNEHASTGFAIKPILIDFHETFEGESIIKELHEEKPAQSIEGKANDYSIREDIGGLSRGSESFDSKEIIKNYEVSDEKKLSEEQGLNGEKDLSEQSSDYENYSLLVETPPCTMETAEITSKVETIQIESDNSKKCCFCLVV